MDVLVVGAGIQGVGVAQAVAAAGHSVLVLERSAPAAGTSSRSSKLIHGGLRYLETLQIALVRESLAERATLLRIAPHLVRLVPFHLPVYAETSRGAPWIRAGLSLYALLGGLGRAARFASLPRGEWEGLDGLRTDGLRAVFRYHDGQTDDAALCRAVLRSALELGAALEMPAELLAAEREGDAWTARYGPPDGGGTGERVARARVLVLAAGPWVDSVAQRLRPEPPRRAVELVGGTHVELEGSLEHGIYYTEAPSDRRAVFVMPWKGHTLVGTTEQPYRGDPARVAPLDAEIRYLEDTLHHYFPRHGGRRLDAWAGLRVLPAGEGAAFRRPREVVLARDDPRRPRVVTVYGGKLTGYRATAHKVLRAIRPSLGPARTRADTRTLLLPADPGPGWRP